MPYHIEERDGRHVVVATDSGRVVGTHPLREKAVRHLRALYANVPDARRKRRSR